MLDNIFLKLERFVPMKWRWVLGHEGFRRYFANTGWMFFGQMFSLGVAFFVGVWMARYLGPENYGVLNYAIAFTGLFAFISTLGVDSILNRDLVKYPEKRDELMGTSFRLKLIGGFLTLLVSSIVILSIESSPLIKFLVILHSFTFVFHSFNVISIFFQSNVEAKKNVKAQLLSSALASILKVVMIVSGMGVIWLVAIYVLESVLLSVFLIISYRSSKLRIMDWKFKYPLAKKILSGSWLLMLTSVSVSIYMRIDQVIIKMMIDESAVGIYSVATKLSEVWNFIPVIICTSLFPAVINARKTDRASYASRLKKLFLLMFALAVSISIVVTLLAKPLILRLFGEQYISAIPVLAIYVWSTVGVFLGVVVGKYLLAENYIKTYFSITLFGAILNIALNIILIPRMGISGAAIATVVSYIMVSAPVIVLLKLRKK